MTDIEDRLRAYGRSVEAEVEPVDRSELRTAGPPAAPPIEMVARRATRHWWRIGGLVAASVIALVAIAAVTRSGSNTLTDQPDESEPDAELTELPTPDPITVDETSVGTITWRRTVGTEIELPEMITGTDVDGALIGRDHDPSITWRSTDGGLTWDRTVSDGVRATINGVEWINRDDLTDEQPGVLTYDDGSGERPLELPDFRVGVEAPFVVETRVGGRDGLPLSVAGRTIISVHRDIRPDFDILTGTDDWGRVEIEREESTWSTVRDAEGTAFSFTIEQDGDRVDLIDADGHVALGINGPPPGLDGVEPAQLLSGGAMINQIFEFVDGEVRPVKVPWAPGDQVLVAEVDGGLLAHGSSFPPSQRLGAWHTTDGVVWEPVDLPATSSSDDGAYINVLDDEILLVDATQRPRMWSSTDGLEYTEIPSPPGGMRSGGDFGWVTVENRDRPHISVSPDGVDWDRLDLRDLLEHGEQSFDFLDFRALDNRIFLTSSRDGQRLLLIGDVTPSTE